MNHQKKNPQITQISQIKRQDKTQQGPSAGSWLFCSFRLVLLLICAICVICGPAYSQIKTTVTDSLLAPDGSPATGTITISAAGAFRSADGYNVAQGWQIQVPVSGGEFTVNLIPNQGATPAGQNDSYSVIYNLTSSLGTSYWSETWFVPSLGPVGLASVRTLPFLPESFLSPQSANTMLAGPATGNSPGSVSFRALVGADLPSPTATSLGGVQLVVCAAGQFVNQISTAGVPGCATPSASGGSMTWPSGTGIPAIAGGSAWGTTYNAANLIPAGFISTLNQNTTGNAATATALAATPTQCTTGQFATGITTNGNANCGTPSSGNATQVNGASVPVSANYLGSNSSGQLVSITGSSGTAIYATQYGAIPDGRFVADATITSGSTTVTCPNSDCNFTSADIGKIVFGTLVGGPSAVYAFNGGSVQNGWVVLPQGTITAVNSANSITVSVAATASHTGGSTSGGCSAASCFGVILTWGSDNSTALANAFTAATTTNPFGPCAPVILPAGLMLIQQAEFINAPVSCIGLVAMNREGIKVIGQGMSATQLVPTPNFNFATCTGPNNGCFGDNYASGQATFAGGTYFKDWSIWGGNNGQANPSTAKNVVVVGHNGILENWACMAWGGYPNTNSQQGNLGGAAVYGTPALLRNFQMDGCGSSFNMKVWNSGGGEGGAPPYVEIDGQSYLGDGVATPLLITAGNVYTYGANIGPQLYNYSTYPSYDVYVTGGNWFSNGDLIGASTEVGNHLTSVTINNASSRAVITNCTITNPVALSTAADIYVQAGTAVVSGCTLKETGTNGLGFYNSGTLIDAGGNTVSATTPLTQAGVFAASPSITGNTLATGNLALTSGWGSATKSGIAGDSHGGAFTITEAGTPAASPVLTLTFPTAYWTAPASCTINQTAGNFTLSNPVTSSLTATSVVFTWTGTPNASDSYTFAYRCGP